MDDIAEVWIMNDPRKGTIEIGYAPEDAPKLPKEKPHWMLDFKREWPTPQSPVTFSFTLKEGYEQEAIDFLYNKDAPKGLEAKSENAYD